VANGTRGTITALNPEPRTLTIRVDGKPPREVTLPGWYLDGRQRTERNRRIDLAYATTGHRAQGLTRWRALVRLTGQEDTHWLYVQLSRARHQTTLYPVVGPEPQGPTELDLPDRDPGDGYSQLAQALSRAGDQRLAIDTPSSLDLRRLSTAELRAERDRLRALLDQAPRDRARELARASVRRAEADQALEELTATNDPQRQGRAMLRLRWRAGPAGADSGVVAVARQQADRAHDSELKLRQQQQRRAGWLEANAHLGPAYWQVVRELAWQRRTSGLIAEHDPPGYLRAELGPVPESTTGGRAWRRPPPRSRTTGGPMGSPTPTRRWARRHRSPPSGPPGSTPAPPPSGPRTASAPATARSARQRPVQPPATAATRTPPPPATSGRPHAGVARSGPPASTAKEASHGQSPD
jgi:hypothetical protein